MIGFVVEHDGGFGGWGKYFSSNNLAKGKKWERLVGFER